MATQSPAFAGQGVKVWCLHCGHSWQRDDPEVGEHRCPWATFADILWGPEGDDESAPLVVPQRRGGRDTDHPGRRAP